jgi:hypothetical protein
MPNEPRPPGGQCFEAVRVAPEGWVCLAPWIQTEEGCWWRPHIAGGEGYGERSRVWAEDMARRLNEAMHESVER